MGVAAVATTGSLSGSLPAVDDFSTGPIDSYHAPVVNEVVRSQDYSELAHLRARQEKLAREAEARKDARQAAAKRAHREAEARARRRQNVAVSPGPVSTGGMSAYEQCVIEHESGGDPKIVNESSGAGGLFQFLPSTWDSLGLGYPGGAQTAPVSVQEEGFAKLYAEDGRSPWITDGC